MEGIYLSIIKVIYNDQDHIECSKDKRVLLRSETIKEYLLSPFLFNVEVRNFREEKEVKSSLPLE